MHLLEEEQRLKAEREWEDRAEDEDEVSALTWGCRTAQGRRQMRFRAQCAPATPPSRVRPRGL
jgi:hypothetical protein